MSEKNLIIFRECPGRPGYRVSNTGAVQSCLVKVRKKSGPGFQWIPSSVWRDKTISPRTKATTHLRVEVLGKTVSVHTLVLEAFVGPCPAGMEACHDPDPDPMNNHVANLRWGTAKDNAVDRAKHGHTACGERSGPAKITEALARQILIECSQPGRHVRSKVARKHGVSLCIVCRIADRKTWKHIA